MRARTPILLLFAFSLAGCDAFGWLGEADDPPLPGRRIPVFESEAALAADSDARGREVALPRPYVNESWPQEHGYPTHAMYHLAIGTGAQQLGALDIGAGIDADRPLIAQPVIADGLIFTLDAEGRASAFEAANGRRVWTYRLTPEGEEDSFLGGGVGYDSGLLVVTLSTAQAMALRGQDGALVWEQSLDGPARAAPAIAAGRAFVASVDNRVVALDMENGRRLWSHEAPFDAAALLGGAAPATDGEVVIAAYSSGEAYGLAAADGRVLWVDSAAGARRADALSGIADVRAAPVIDRETVLIVGAADRMIAVDRRTGRRLWERDVGGVETPWAGGDYFFALTRQSELIAVSRLDGAIVWVRPLPRFEDEADREGPIRWRGPLLASDRLIVANSMGEMWAVSPYDGRVLGAQQLDGIPAGAPIVADGALHILTADGRLLGFR